ncbi:MAG TPA: PEGA domain-containing protein [Tepidisphaeraceae bacterium]
MVFAGSGGCVERILSVQSNPPGALVYLNGQEMGRTPVERDFTWYGTYDVVVRHEGYETIKKNEPVIAPIYEWVPLDLFSELLPIPIKDRHVVKYELKAMPPATEPSPGLMNRAEEMKGKLEGSHFPATTQASKK